MNLTSNLFEDVKLVFPRTGETLLAHRLVLSSASPVLRTLLQSEGLCGNSQVARLILPEFDFEITNQLVSLIYRGEVRLGEDQYELLDEQCSCNKTLLNITLTIIFII